MSLLTQLISFREDSQRKYSFEGKWDATSASSENKPRDGLMPCTPTLSKLDVLSYLS